MKNIFIILTLSIFICTGILQSSPHSKNKGIHYPQSQNKEAMIRDLDFIKGLLEVGYAPLRWKKKHLGYDLEKEYRQAKQEILNRHLSLKDYQQLLRRFLKKTKDYHVSISFHSTEKAELPFRVRTAEGRTFIDWIDRDEFPLIDHSDIEIGDELLKFDDLPIQIVIKELLEQNSSNSNEATDQSLADINLTSRKGYKGDSIPIGSINITVRKKDGGVVEKTLLWALLSRICATTISLYAEYDIFMF